LGDDRIAVSAGAQGDPAQLSWVVLESSSALQVVVHSDTKTIGSPAFAAAISSAERTLHSDRRVAMVVAPQPGVSISRDGHTAVVQAGAAASPNGPRRR